MSEQTFTTWDKRGRAFASKSGLLGTLVDDALAGLDCGFPEVTRERLEALYDALESIQKAGDEKWSIEPAWPQSDYVKARP